MRDFFQVLFRYFKDYGPKKDPEIETKNETQSQLLDCTQFFLF